MWFINKQKKHVLFTRCGIPLLLFVIIAIYIIFSHGHIHSGHDIADDYYLDENHRLLKVTERYEGEILGEFIIPAHILRYQVHNDYVIVQQSPDSADYKSYVEDEYLSQTEKDSIRSLYNKMFAIKDCYWIIVRKEDKVVGPLTKYDFDIRCKDFGYDNSF